MVKHILIVHCYILDASGSCTNVRNLEEFKENTNNER